MPMGEYKDFEDCVKKNADKGDANAYCAEIKRKIEERQNRSIETPDSIGRITLTKDDASGVRVEGIALTEGTFNGLFYPAEELEKVAKNLSGKLMTINHGKKLQDIVGVFENARWDNGIKFDAAVDTNWVANLIRKHKGEIGISLELYVKKFKNEQLKRLEAHDIEVIRGSLVLEPACSTDKCPVVPIQNQFDLTRMIFKEAIELATKCESKYMNKDRTRYLKGWEGCLESKQTCTGFDKRHAEVMCGMIFRRRGGKGVVTPYNR